eukprot:1382248-Amphidinium_carterae.1
MEVSLEHQCRLKLFQHAGVFDCKVAQLHMAKGKVLDRSSQAVLLKLGVHGTVCQRMNHCSGTVLAGT